MATKFGTKLGFCKKIRLGSFVSVAAAAAAVVVVVA